MSAQPIHEGLDPRDPQVIHDLLPAEERPEFLRQYHQALTAAGDSIANYRELRRCLAKWRLTADSLNDPAYHQAIAEATEPNTPGVTLDELDAMRRAG